MKDLRDQLIQFANELVAEQWYSSSSYETTIEDRIQEAIANCKVDIGKCLLKIMGVVDTEGKNEKYHL